jgi:hypothetical protein
VLVRVFSVVQIANFYIYIFIYLFATNAIALPAFLQVVDSIPAAPHLAVHRTKVVVRRFSDSSNKPLRLRLAVITSTADSDCVCTGMATSTVFVLVLDQHTNPLLKLFFQLTFSDDSCRSLTFYDVFQPDVL